MQFYGTVAEYVEYHEARGRIIPTTWDDAGMTADLIVASEWLDGTYGNLFAGQKTDGFQQDREWPRTGAVTNTPDAHVFADDEIPQRVINAAYEAAWRQGNKPGALLMDYTPGKYKSVSISGALSVDFAGFNFASDIQTTFPIIDMLLAPLFDPNSDGSFSAYTGAVARG